MDAAIRSVDDLAAELYASDRKLSIFLFVLRSAISDDVFGRAISRYMVGAASNMDTLAARSVVMYGVHARLFLREGAAIAVNQYILT